MEEGELHVDFNGREVTYGFGELDELILAHATSMVFVAPASNGLSVSAVARLRSRLQCGCQRVRSSKTSVFSGSIRGSCPRRVQLPVWAPLTLP
jgi:hypothetical protein